MKRNVSRLRKACVKAETFSATDLGEYHSAKQSLDNALAYQLEVTARRILSTHGVLADPRCNVRLDLASGPTLLLRDMPVDAGFSNGGGGIRKIKAAGGGHSAAAAVVPVGRQLPLPLPSEGDEGLVGEAQHHHPHGATCGAAACGVNGGDDVVVRGSHGSGGGGSSTTVVEDNSSGGGAVAVVVGAYDSSGCRQQAAATTSAAATGAAGAPVVVEVLSGADVMTTTMASSSSWGAGQGQPRDGLEMQQQLSQRQVQELAGVRRNAERDFLACVTRQEEEHRRACDGDQAALEARDAEETYRQEYIARLDARGVREEERLAVENRRLLAEEERRRRDEEERKRRSDADRLKELWASDGEFFRLLSFAAASLAAAALAFRKGFSLAPGAILDAAWGLVVAECGAAAAQGGADDGTTPAAGGGASFAALSATEAGSCSSALAGHDDGGVCGAGGGAGGGGGGWAEVAATGSGAGGGGAADGSESALWWVWSTAGSSALAVIRAGYSSTGWLLGQTLGLVAPTGVQCEIGAVLSLCGWLFTLVLAMKLAGVLLGRNGGSGPVGAVVHWLLLGAWVWGRFHDSVQHASRELLLLVAPAPVLVLAYGAALRYVERHRRPDGCWWVRGWDVRAVWSRALPFVASVVLACGLGAQAAS